MKPGDLVIVSTGWSLWQTPSLQSIEASRARSLNSRGVVLLLAGRFEMSIADSAKYGYHGWWLVAGDDFVGWIIDDAIAGALV